MNTYCVHIYPIVRVVYDNIQAQTPEQAQEMAAKRFTDDLAGAGEITGENIGSFDAFVVDQMGQHEREVTWHFDAAGKLQFREEA